MAEKNKKRGNALDLLCINTIRTLAMDAVQKANSGHPGTPMALAPLAYLLWTRHLRHNPQNPRWPNRDRFVLSAGHASMLLYSLLYLTGYDLSLEEIRNFRQWGSLTPGHPEHGLTPGVEITTGPLGQGLSAAVGMALAERWLAARFNRPGYPILDHSTYVVASDGDLMEGVASEACSLAGHLKLGKLLCFYDENHISIDGSTDMTFTENVAQRFGAYGWHVQRVADGNDLTAMEKAIQKARGKKDRPSLIILRTHIAYGSPHKQDTASAHGSPLGEEEVRLTKERLGWPTDPSFLVPEKALREFRKCVTKGKAFEESWTAGFEKYSKSHPGPAREFERTLQGELPPNWETTLPIFQLQDKPLATRQASEGAIGAIAKNLPELLGGSADLNPSTLTYIQGGGDISGVDFTARNIRFGVREHAMGAILNGMALHGGIRPYGSTFLIFSDYMRPAIRLAALMELPVLYIFTHDSIGLGEDGPTHQPVEHLASLRTIPHLVLLRPADANETAAAWRVAIEHRTGPVALALSRQKLPILDPQRARWENVRRGGYVLWEAKPSSPPEITLIATGSEVSLALEAGKKLAEQEVAARVVSLPSWELFEAQSAEYKNAVLPPGPRISIEAASPLGWERYVGGNGIILGLSRFGASAPEKTVMKNLGFNVENVLALCRRLLSQPSAAAS